MTDELVADRAPPTAVDRPSGGGAHGGPQPGVGDERGDLPGQRGGGIRGEMQPGAPVLDDVEQTTGGRCDHRHAAGLRLLRSLAERLVGTGVDEHVQARHDRRQLGPGAEPEERRPVQLPFEGGPHRPVTDDDQAYSGEIRHRVEQMHPLLPGEPAHVADQHLTVRGQSAAQSRVTVAWVEPIEVDAACPAGNPVDALAQQHVDRGPGRCEGPPGHPVNGRHPAPDGAFCLAEPVAGGEAGEIGLVDRHTGQPEPPGGERGLRAEPGRGGEMHDVGAEVREDTDQAWPWSGHPECRISWQWNGRCPQHRGTRVDVGIGRRCVGASRGGDDERFVTTVPQMLQHPADRVRHTVDMRQERLGDHCYAHDITVASLGDGPQTPACPPHERCDTVWWSGVAWRE